MKILISSDSNTYILFIIWNQAMIEASATPNPTKGDKGFHKLTFEDFSSFCWKIIRTFYSIISSNTNFLPSFPRFSYFLQSKLFKRWWICEIFRFTNKIILSEFCLYKCFRDNYSLSGVTPFKSKYLAFGFSKYTETLFYFFEKSDGF